MHASLSHRMILILSFMIAMIYLLFFLFRSMRLISLPRTSFWTMGYEVKCSVGALGEGVLEGWRKGGEMDGWVIYVLLT
jgi:hypothetical protein